MDQEREKVYGLRERERRWTEELRESKERKSSHNLEENIIYSILQALRGP